MPTVVTWDVLKSLGFTEDKSVFSDPPGGLSFDFGNFKLSAVVCLNRWLQPVIRLSGVMSMPRTTTLMEDEIPQEVESREQAIALVTWCLDNNADEKFEPSVTVPWLEEGRTYRSFLPWEKDRMAFAARPACRVDRDWMKIALHKLRPSLETNSAEVTITFEFDGEVLKIQYPDGTLAMPASGKAWPSRFSIPAANLRRLPKRLMHYKIEVSVWESSLSLGNRTYPGVVALEEKG